MAIRVALNHKTRYRYASDVWLSPHVVRLHPAPHCRTPILAYSCKVTPSEQFVGFDAEKALLDGLRAGQIDALVVLFGSQPHS